MLFLAKVDPTKDLDILFAISSLRTEVLNAMLQHIKFADQAGEEDQSQQASSAPVPVVAAPVRPVSAAPARRFSLFSPSSRGLSAAAVAAAAVSEANFPEPYHLSNEENNMWSVFAGKDSTIIATSLVNKPNPVGKPLMRQIILTSKRELLYVDPSTMEIKGTIDVTPGKALWPIAKLESDKTFYVRECTGTREYKFIDSRYGAKFWVDTIISLQ